MKGILLTGATGFLGSHLLKRMVAEGNNVIVLKRSFSDTWRIDNILSKVKCYNADLCTMDSVFSENRIDCIVHTAVNYGRNGEKLSEVLRDNLFFPMQLAECALQFGCNCFINTDSFFTKGSVNYDYLSHYTLSKKLFVQGLRALPLKIVNCKLEHLYGLFDDRGKFIPSIISQIMQSKEAIHLTDGAQKRDFVFVEDVVEAYSVIIQRTDQLQGFVEFEIGTGKPISIFEVVNLIRSEIPESNTRLNWGAVPRRAGEFEASWADTSSIERLGWTAKKDITQGIKEIIKYHRTNGI